MERSEDPGRQDRRRGPANTETVDRRQGRLQRTILQSQGRRNRTETGPETTPAVAFRWSQSTNAPYGGQIRGHVLYRTLGQDLVYQRKVDSGKCSAEGKEVGEDNFRSRSSDSFRRKIRNENARQGD